MKLLEPEYVFPKGVMAKAWLTCPTSLQPFCVAHGQAGRLLGDGIIPKLLKNSSTHPRQSTYLSVRKRTKQTINDNKECLLNSNAVTVMVPDRCLLKFSGQSSEEHVLFCVYSQGPRAQSVAGSLDAPHRWQSCGSRDTVGWWCLLLLLSSCVASALRDVPWDGAIDTLQIYITLQIGFQKSSLKSSGNFFNFDVQNRWKRSQNGQGLPCTEAEPKDTDLLRGKYRWTGWN